MSGQSSVKPNRPSLAKILLSLDGNLAKQQALSHVLSALQIMYARYGVPLVLIIDFVFYNMNLEEEFTKNKEEVNI